MSSLLCADLKGIIFGCTCTIYTLSVIILALIVVEFWRTFVSELCLPGHLIAFNMVGNRTVAVQLKQQPLEEKKNGLTLTNQLSACQHLEFMSKVQKNIEKDGKQDI